MFAYVLHTARPAGTLREDLGVEDPCVLEVFTVGYLGATGREGGLVLVRVVIGHVRQGAAVKIHGVDFEVGVIEGACEGKLLTIGGEVGVYLDSVRRVGEVGPPQAFGGDGPDVPVLLEGYLGSVRGPGKAVLEGGVVGDHPLLGAVSFHHPEVGLRSGAPIGSGERLLPQERDLGAVRGPGGTPLVAVVGVRESLLALAGAGHHVDVLVDFDGAGGAGVGYLGSVRREVGVAGARGVGELLHPRSVG